MGVDKRGSLCKAGVDMKKMGIGGICLYIATQHKEVVRVMYKDKIARSLYFYQVGAKIVITHGFIKKTRKTPRKEIERAKNLREQYMKRLKRD